MDTHSVRENRTRPRSTAALSPLTRALRSTRVRSWRRRLSPPLAFVAVVIVLEAQGQGTVLNDDAPPSTSPDVVISQVYGGGGNAGASLTHDFVELFNAGAVSVSLTGWSLQYATSAGTSWQSTALTG